MKTFYSFLLSCFFTITAFSQNWPAGPNDSYNRQMVTITFNESKSLQVIIDGNTYSPGNTYNRNYPNSNGDVITVSHLQPGQHSLQVVKTKNGFWSSNRNKVLYSSSFNLHANDGINIMVNNGNNIQINENNGRWNHDRDHGYSQAMPEYQFSQLLKTVRNKWFQSNKIIEVRSAFSNTSNYFTTNQVHQLISIINNESERLQLAELSYRSVVDRQNFSQIYDLFLNQSNRYELERYVRSYRF